MINLLSACCDFTVFCLCVSVYVWTVCGLCVCVCGVKGQGYICSQLTSIFSFHFFFYFISLPLLKLAHDIECYSPFKVKNVFDSFWSRPSVLILLVNYSSLVELACTGISLVLVAVWVGLHCNQCQTVNVFPKTKGPRVKAIVYTFSYTRAANTMQ